VSTPVVFKLKEHVPIQAEVVNDYETPSGLSLLSNVLGDEELGWVDPRGVMHCS